MQEIIKDYLNNDKELCKKYLKAEKKYYKKLGDKYEKISFEIDLDKQIIKNL